MIIECINCNKKFNVSADLIPKQGRQIQCGSCKHIWHFKIESSLKEPLILEDEDKELMDNKILDKDIIPEAQNLEPAYIVFENYEKILQWNRSLRFALAVCTLKEKFENVL